VVGERARAEDLLACARTFRIRRARLTIREIQCTSPCEQYALSGRCDPIAPSRPCLAARAVNRANRRSGAVWGERYHGRAPRTPREVRNGLVYVLLNFRKHLRAPRGIDPRSSGAWFDGWADEVPPHGAPCPVVPARTWLASVGWRRAGGRISARETPAGTEPHPSQ